MAKPRKTVKKNVHLKQPEIFDKIAQVRKNLEGTDFPEHLEEVDGWEARAKSALIKLALDGHEAIVMLREGIAKEIAEIDERLKVEKSDILPDSIRDALIAKKEAFEWLKEFFEEARRDLDDVTRNVDNQLTDEENNL